MPILPRACTASSFRQRLRIYAWDRCSARRHEGSDARKLWQAELLCEMLVFPLLARKSGGHAWKRMDMRRDLRKDGKGGGFRCFKYTPVVTISWLVN